MVSNKSMARVQSPGAPPRSLSWICWFTRGHTVVKEKMLMECYGNSWVSQRMISWWLFHICTGLLEAISHNLMRYMNYSMAYTSENSTNKWLSFHPADLHLEKPYKSEVLTHRHMPSSEQNTIIPIPHKMQRERERGMRVRIHIYIYICVYVYVYVYVWLYMLYYVIHIGLLRLLRTWTSKYACTKCWYIWISAIHLTSVQVAGRYSSQGRIEGHHIRPPRHDKRRIYSYGRCRKIHCYHRRK